MTALRFGVIGCASIARRAVLPAIAASPLAEVVAVASRDPERAGQVADQVGGRAETDYAAVLDAPDVDAVYIPLPTALHATWAVRALQAGKHVLVEKPLAADTAQARQVVEASRAADRAVQEGFMFLYHSQHAAIRARVEAGAIGELQEFESTFGIPLLPAGDFRYQAELGGGALLDLAGYPVRAARYWLGDLTVTGAARRIPPGYEVDLSGAALLRTADGRAARVAFGMDHHYRCSYTLWGSEGSITLDRAYTTPASLRPTLRLERQDHHEQITLDADNHFANMIGHFAKTVTDTDEAERQRADIVTQAELISSIRRAGAAPKE
jgi:predicted dehydrogenase